MISDNILFFADRLPPLIGGMEMHARYFIEYFTHHQRFPLVGVITKDCEGNDSLLSSGPIDIHDLPKHFDPSVIFFNSGRWIEELEEGGVGEHLSIGRSVCVVLYEAEASRAALRWSRANQPQFAVRLSFECEHSRYVNGYGIHGRKLDLSTTDIFDR